MIAWLNDKHHLLLAVHNIFCRLARKFFYKFNPEKKFQYKVLFKGRQENETWRGVSI